tara:strand:- start:45 stop:317 length:273 start_codon:yes stop_codon:yes gene_type:complete
LIHVYNIYKYKIIYLQVFTSKINKNIEYYIICKYSKFMSHPFENKNKSRAELENIKNNQFSQKGLFVNDDDQDWGSAGMNDIQNETDISQ